MESRPDRNSLVSPVKRRYLWGALRCGAATPLERFGMSSNVKSFTAVTVVKAARRQPEASASTKTLSDPKLKRPPLLTETTARSEVPNAMGRAISNRPRPTGTVSPERADAHRMLTQRDATLRMVSVFEGRLKEQGASAVNNLKLTSSDLERLRSSLLASSRSYIQPK